ncbi:MAG TPA: hypothetical protein VNZ52_06430, partial [Candidatus Thermoplasmatota archaeon]|nr:hypothetical protein [Candidatus Thermoplasmatota archaeon]
MRAAPSTLTGSLLLATFTLLACAALLPTAAAQTLQVVVDAGQTTTTPDGQGVNVVTSGDPFTGTEREITFLNLSDGCTSEGCSWGRMFYLVSPAGGNHTDAVASAAAYQYESGLNRMAVYFPSITLTPGGVWFLTPAEDYLVASFQTTSPVPPPADPVEVFHEDFESGAPGWNATGLWHLTTDHAYSANTSFYFGIEHGPGREDNNYATGAAESGTLTTPE